tara:strand:- start:269 stop:589 length:321 start_codon:yes stop_codon:yes gene_type:complete
MSEKHKTARSYRGSIIDDNAVISLNIKWLGQILLLVAGLVYGYWRVESRLAALEDKVIIADEQIGDLLGKHIMEERIEREELANKIAFYEKEFNINPLSWGKKKRK